MAIQIPSKKPLVVHLVDRVEAFHALKDRWNELVDDSTYPNFFRRYEWIETWWEWFGKHLGNFFVLFLENDGVPVGAVPMWESGKRLNFLGFGARPCPEYPGIIIQHGFQESVRAAVVQWLKSNGNQWDEIVLDEYALDDDATVELVKQLKTMYPFWTQPGEDRYYIPLPKTYDDYLATRSAHNRQKKRTRLRKVLKSYRAELKNAEISQINEWFSLIPKFSTMSLSRRGNVSPWLQENYAGFHKALMKMLIPTGEVRLAFLECDDKPVAFRYGFAYKKKFYGFQTACDPSHPSHPGDTLTQMFLIQLIDEGFTEFDFLRGLEDYKSNWTDHMRKTEIVRVFRTRGFRFWKRVLWENFVRPLVRFAKNRFINRKK